MEFFKYQSLGNDFVLFDWFNKNSCHPRDLSVEALRARRSLGEDGAKLEGGDPLDQLQDPKWSSFVTSICQRHFGVGADGVLILTQDKDLKIPKALIYNSDGSKAEVCFNGIRCIASHLLTHHNFPESFDVSMGGRKISCKVFKQDNGVIEVETNVGKAISIEEKTIELICRPREPICHPREGGDPGNCGSCKFTGSFVDFGNPHFVIFQQTTSEWLKDHGSKLECHETFLKKANIEFVWKDASQDFYNMLVFERGCGITLACSSGAAAVMATLWEKGKIQKEEKVSIKMPGGFLTSRLDSSCNVLQLAEALLVFRGTLFIF